MNRLPVIPLKLHLTNLKVRKFVLFYIYISKRQKFPQAASLSEICSLRIIKNLFLEDEHGVDIRNVGLLSEPTWLVARVDFTSLSICEAFKSGNVLNGV